MKNLSSASLRLANRDYSQVITDQLLSRFAKMAVANTPTTMAGDFKNLYKESGLINAIPSWAIVQDRFPFEEAEAGLGQFYVFGVVLQKEQGFTYAPSSGANSGVQTMNASIAGYIGQARLGLLAA